MSDKGNKVLYVVVNNSIPDYAKVGQTHYIKQRLKSLSSATPKKYEIVATLEIPNDVSDSDFFDYLKNKYPDCFEPKEKDNESCESGVYNESYDTEFVRLWIVSLEKLIEEIMSFAKEKKIKIKFESEWYSDTTDNSDISKKANVELRLLMKEKRIRQYQIAERLGMKDCQFSEYFSKERSLEEKKLIKSIIKSIVKERGN